MRFLKTEAGAVILWLAGTVTLAAGVFPWIYRSGQAFAAYAASSDLAPVWESVGRSAAKAEVGTYFSRSLYVAVLLLIPFLVLRLRKIRNRGGQSSPLAPSPLPWKSRLTQLGAAILLSAGVLWLLGTVLLSAGAFAPDPDPASFSRVMSKALIPSFFAAVIEEWLFRGLLLGIWLRILKPGAALFTVSFIFAFVHFLAPPNGSTIEDPASLLSGFRLLGLIFGHFLNPQFIAAEFLVLFTVGLILGATRLRTGALWFPIGLHAGWIFSFKSFNMLHVETLSPLRPLWIGDSLRSGLLPLAALLFTALICHFFLKCEKAGTGRPRS